ncbi:hypothetical protein [uncultured Roseibium sp.]|uniref:hypothetical protein n=1 Tax=uncultured Roseibium sp. TaxID=1936171 RepID=UPI0032179283
MKEPTLPPVPGFEECAFVASLELFFNEGMGEIAVVDVIFHDPIGNAPSLMPLRFSERDHSGENLLEIANDAISPLLRALHDCTGPSIDAES